MDLKDSFIVTLCVFVIVLVFVGAGRTAMQQKEEMRQITVTIAKCVKDGNRVEDCRALQAGGLLQTKESD